MTSIPTARTRSRAWAWLAVLAPTLIIATARWGAGPGPAADDYATYIIHARNVVHGRPYGDLLCAPVPLYGCPRVQPPGLPLTLAAVFAVAGERPGVVAAVMLALSIAFAVVAGRAFARDAWPAALGVTMLTLLAPQVGDYAQHVQTDLPFALCAWAAIALADRPGPWRSGRIVGILALAAAAMAFRVIGVALVPALALVAWLRRRELGLAGFVPALSLGAAGLAGLLAANPGILAEVSGWFSPARLVGSAALNMRPLWRAVCEALLYPFPWGRVNDAWHVGGALVALLGLLDWIRGGAARRLAWQFGWCYFVMVMLLPFGTYRYFWPLTPLLVFALLRGLSVIIAAVPHPGVASRTGAVALAVAVLLALGGMRAALRQPRAGWLSSQADVRAVFEYLKRTGDRATTRVAFFRPRILSLETGLVATSILPAPHALVRRAFERQCITHVVVGSLGTVQRANAATQSLVRIYAEDFTIEYRNPSFTVYRFDGPRCARAG